MLSRRTIADQEVLAPIAPLSKLIVRHKLGKKSAATLKQPSLTSGAIRANTSCSAVILLDATIFIISQQMFIYSKVKASYFHIL